MVDRPSVRENCCVEGREPREYDDLIFFRSNSSSPALKMRSRAAAEFSASSSAPWSGACRAAARAVEA
jgi:hypothetical protein